MATKSSPSPTHKPQAIPWTHQETVNLINAYQEKWYSLKRGQLRSSQWEEVAVTVAIRCGYDYSEPSKSAIQCRHKMEKLRQRYRAEKQRIAASKGFCPWQYFHLMDEMEIGPLPISARPLKSMMVPPCNYARKVDKYEEEEEEEEEAEEEVEFIRSKSRNINHIIRDRPTVMNLPRYSSANSSRALQERALKRNWRMLEDEDEAEWQEDEVEEEEDEQEEEEEEGEEEEEKGRELVSGLAAEIRAFSKRFIGMENLKMEMMKETERCRLEMENRRMEMILEFHHRIVDSIGRAFEFPKRTKISQEI